MGKSLEELLAELERKAKEQIEKTPVSENAGATVLEHRTSVPEGSTTVSEADATMPEDEATVLEDDATSPASALEPSFARGKLLLDTYRIDSDPIHGGMGSVWKVHHNNWNVDLAMKRPQAKLFQSEAQKENFINECKTWIDLGLHPNIVSCYYVREIEGVPTIFSEWMENGSLENRIQDGSLYKGTEKEQQERLLDIAIQFARGLHYAHEQGRIHQDVKPDNLLLSKGWDAKVADFGLARARAQLTVLEGANTELDAGATVMAPSGGYTPAYCSMEQMDGKLLTRRTDIYSWAVSVMEMYIGGRPWANGVVAGLSCREYFGETRVPMPEALKALLEQCMASKPEDRPLDFAEIEAALQKIYRETVSDGYPRPVPKAASDTAESLNNRALSYLDMGMTDMAEKLWKQALEKDGSRFLFHYNYAIFQWNARRFSDVELLDYLKKHNDGSTLYQNTMDALSRMRGGWDREDGKIIYRNGEKRPTEYEPLRKGTDVSIDGRYKVIGYDECDKWHQHHFGYRIKDLATGKITDYPNVFEDYGNSDSRDDGVQLHAHYYKSDKVFFVGEQSEIVVMEADVLWFFDAKTGRLILSLPPYTMWDGNTSSYEILGYTESGIVKYSEPGDPSRRDLVCELRFCPEEKFPFALSCIASYRTRIEAEQNVEKNYREADICWKRGDIYGCYRNLNRSLDEQVLTLHEPSMRLWTELSKHYKRGNLVAVIPTEDMPTPSPKRNKRTEEPVLQRLEENRNRTDNGQTAVKLKEIKEDYEFDSCTDIYTFTFRYSLTATDTLSGEVYFEIPNLETSIEEAESRWFSDCRFLALKEDHMLWYAGEDKDGEWIDLSGKSPCFALPGGYWLKNTEEGVDIGGHLFDDRFDDFRPLWNADVIACRKHNYRLIYRYEVPDET